MQLSEFKQNFEPRFRQTLQELINSCVGLTTDPFLHQLVDYSQEVASHGKRLRPYLTWLGYRAGGGTNDDALYQLAAGVELFHTFCLIHDDVIDKATTRHGVKTVEAYALHELRSLQRLGDLEHNARSQAILVGDLFFGWAAKSILSAARLTGTIELVSENFFQVANEVIVGQMIDVDTMTREEQNEEILFEKFRLKTATYSFVRPFKLGLALAGVTDPNYFKAAEDIGTPLGIAFQIQDDNLDVTSNAAALGKPVFADLADGQQTLLTTFLFAHPQIEFKQQLLSIIRQPMTPDLESKARKLFEDSGAVAYANKRAGELFLAAETAIAGAPFPGEVSDSLLQVLELIKGRTA